MAVRRGTSLRDRGDELEAVVDVENLLPIDETEQPIPRRAIEKEFSDVVATRISVETGRDDEAQPAAGRQQVVGEFEKQLVRVEVRAPLKGKRLLRRREAQPA